MLLMNQKKKKIEEITYMSIHKIDQLFCIHSKLKATKVKRKT